MRTTELTPNAAALAPTIQHVGRGPWWRLFIAKGAARARNPKCEKRNIRKKQPLESCDFFTLTSYDLVEPIIPFLLHSIRFTVVVAGRRTPGRGRGLWPWPGPIRLYKNGTRLPNVSYFRNAAASSRLRSSEAVSHFRNPSTHHALAG